MKRQENKTVITYKRWRNAHYALKVAPYPTVAVPFAVELGLNWKQWFPEGKDSTTVGIGLAMAIMATLLSVLAVAKKDSSLMKKVGPFVAIGIAFVAWGAVCVFLSTVLHELGKMLLFAGCGVLAAAVEDSIDRNVVQAKYEFAKQVAKDNGFTKQGKWEQDVMRQAEIDKKNMEVSPVE